MELPASWNLKVEKRSDGKADVVGMDAAGEQYVARTMESSVPSEKDVQALYLGSPERQDAKSFIGHVERQIAEREKNWEQDFAEKCDEAGDIVACGAVERTRIGYNRRYGTGFSKIDWRN